MQAERPTRLIDQDDFRRELSLLRFEVVEPSEATIEARWSEHPQALLLHLTPEFRFAVRVFRLCHDIPLEPDSNLHVMREMSRLQAAGAYQHLLANLDVFANAVLPSPRSDAWREFFMSAVYGWWRPPAKVSWEISVNHATQTWAGGTLTFTADTSEQELRKAWRELQLTVRERGWLGHAKLGGGSNRDIYRTYRFVVGVELGKTYGEIADAEVDKEGITDDAVRKQIERLNAHIRKFALPEELDGAVERGWAEGQRLLRARVQALTSTRPPRPHQL